MCLLPCLCVYITSHTQPDPNKRGYNIIWRGAIHIQEGLRNGENNFDFFTRKNV